MNYISFKPTMIMLLQAMSINKRITPSAVSAVETFIYGVMGRLCGLSMNLKVDDRPRRTLSLRTVQTALQSVLPYNLYTIAVSQGTKAVEKFKRYRQEDDPSFTDDVKTVFSYGLGHIKVYRVVYVYLAAVVDYLIAELLEVSALRTDKATLGKKDIETTIKTDPDLKVVWEQLWNH